MLDLSPAKMLDEIRASKTFLEGFLKNWDEDMSRYHGPGYRQDQKTDLTDPENHAFEWVSLVVPQLVFGSPRVKVGTSRVGTQRDVARAMQFGLNRWAKDSKLNKVNEKLAVDFGMKWAVAIVMPGYEEGVSEFDDARNWPTVKRISPRRYVWDHLATSMEESRFRGHVTIRDKDDLLREAKSDKTWNYEGIKSITEGYEVNELRNEEHQEGYPFRHEVAYYDLWIPEVNGENVHLLKDKYGVNSPKEKYVKGKHNGIWVTLGVGQSGDGDPKAAYIREARWYWGHRSGPYEWIGCYVVPDEAAPLAPIPAVEAQADELNDHARVLSKAMAVHKKAIFVSGQDPNLQDKVRELEDHYVIAIDNIEDIDKHIVERELGGATDTHITHNAILRDRLNRNSGLTETARGNVGSNATATEVATADQSATIRFEFISSKFREGVKGILLKVAWYLYHDDKVQFALGSEAEGKFYEIDEITGEKNPVVEAWFQGGSFDEDSGATFDSLDLEIEAFSMERTSEALQQRRLAELDATLANLVPMMAQYSFVDWEKYLEIRGEMMNMPGLGDLIDVEAAREFAAMMTQAQLQTDGKGAAPPQPRIGRDIGALPKKTPGMDRGSMPGVMSGVDIGSGGKRMEGLTNGTGAL